MTDFLKGNTPATIYKQLLGVGAAGDHAGLTASLKQVFTDDGAGGATASSIKISTTASGWQDIISFRPKVTGTGADPGASTLYAVASGYIVVNLHANGVGNGHRRMEFAVFYDGSNAASADGYNNNTSGTAIDFRIERVGWVSTLQVQRTGSMTGLQGGAFVELNFMKGAGGNGDNIYWDVT